MPFGALAPLPLRLGGSAVHGLTATQHARLCADMCAAKRTAPFAIVTFVGTDDLGGYAPTIESVYSQVGVSTAAYSGDSPDYPLWQPTAAAMGAGSYLLTWPASIEDPYGVRQPVNLTGRVMATVHARECAWAHATTDPSFGGAANVVAALAWRDDSGPAALSEARITLVVW